MFNGNDHSSTCKKKNRIIALTCCVLKDFRRAWLDFIKRPTVSPRPAALDNSKLLCDHGQLIFDLDDPLDAEDESGIGIVKEEEWRYLQAMYEGLDRQSLFLFSDAGTPNAC